MLAWVLLNLLNLLKTPRHNGLSNVGVFLFFNSFLLLLFSYSCPTFFPIALPSHIKIQGLASRLGLEGNSDTFNKWLPTCVSWMAGTLLIIFKSAEMGGKEQRIASQSLWECYISSPLTFSFWAHQDTKEVMKCGFQWCSHEPSKALLQ